MNAEMEAKLEVINAMITVLGKLINAEIRLTYADPPREEAAREMCARRTQLRAQIDELQGHLADQWTISAVALREQLRDANTRVQRYILNIRKDIDVATNAVKLIGQIDEALCFLRTVVAVA